MIRPWITLPLLGKIKLSPRQAQQAQDRRLETPEQLRWGFHNQQLLLSLPQLLLLLSIILLPSTVGAGSWRRTEMAAMMDDGGGWACCGRHEKQDWQEKGEVEEAEQEKKVKKEEMVVVRVAPVRWRHSPGVKHTHTGEKNRKKEEGKSCRRWQDWSLKWPTPINKKKKKNFFFFYFKKKWKLNLEKI